MPQRTPCRRITFWLLTGGVVLSAAAIVAKWKVIAGLALISVIWQHQETQASVEVPPLWVSSQPLEKVGDETFRVPPENLDALMVRTVGLFRHLPRNPST